MTTLITLVIPIGGDAGPFDLYSNVGGYAIPFATGISAAVLQAGYTSSAVPNGTTIIRVTSVGVCTNHIDITVGLIPTTTTTSSSSTSTSTTSTSTTTVPPTSTTTSTSSSTSTSTTTTTDVPTTTSTTTIPPTSTTTSTSSSTSTSTSTSTTLPPTTTTTTSSGPPVFPLSGTWDMTSANNNVRIISIVDISGTSVSCLGAICNFPIDSSSGNYTATPPTSDGTTPISTPTTATLSLNLSWVSVIPGATYYFSITVTGQSPISQSVTYGTPFVTLNIPGLTTGAENVNILFTGTF